MGGFEMTIQKLIKGVIVTRFVSWAKSLNLDRILQFSTQRIA